MLKSKCFCSHILVLTFHLNKKKILYFQKLHLGYLSFFFVLYFSETGNYRSPHSSLGGCLGSCLDKALEWSDCGEERTSALGFCTYMILIWWGLPGEAYPGFSDIQTWPLYVWIDFHRSYGSVFIGWVQLLVAELLPSMVIWWDFSSFHYFSNLTEGLLCLEVLHGDLRFKGRDILKRSLLCGEVFTWTWDLKLGDNSKILCRIWFHMVIVMSVLMRW